MGAGVVRRLASPFWPRGLAGRTVLLLLATLVEPALRLLVRGEAVTTVAPPLTEGHVEVEAGCSTGAGLTHVFIADSPST